MEQKPNTNNTKWLDFLRKVSIFEHSNEENLQKIADVLIEREVESGITLFHKGDAAESMFIIQKGKVKVHDGDYVFSTLDNGYIFGEYALFDKETRSASVTTIDKCRFLELTRKDFDALIDKNITIVRAITRVLTSRIRTMNELEEKLGQSYREIHHQKEEIEKQKQQLQLQNIELRKLNLEKNYLIDVVAHDLRNPLTSNTCAIELLATNSEEFSEEQNEYLGLMKNSVNRMTSIINKILDNQVIDAETVKLELDHHDISLILKEVHSQFKEIATRKKITVIQITEPLFAFIDKSYTAQIFENLISNAIKFSPKGSTIYIKVFEYKGFIRFEIKDEGPGIPPQDMKILFSRYQKLSAKPTDGEKSTGLGLSIVKKYVEAMKGEVWCESTLGQGSKFIVIFEQSTPLK